MAAEDEITALINEAELAAIDEFEGEPAVEWTFRRMAAFIRARILDQVVEGRWAKWKVTDLAHMVGVEVRVEPGGIATPIKVRYDFAKTKLPMLVGR